MSIIDGLNKYLTEMTSNSRGIISVTVVSIADGNVIGYRSQNPDVDNRLSASFQIEVMRQISRGLNYVDNIKSKEVKDLVVTLEEQIHLAFVSASKEYVIHIIADTKEANEGLVKMLHAKYVPLLN
ncbi:MAG: hypothetical protein Q4G08_00155 [Capnocytophaga sp.]|nr:hypothetical protein [Capnocytophaga sp.]